MKSDKNAIFSDRFSSLCKKAGISVSELCREMGVSRTQIYDIKNCKIPVSEKMWDLLETAEIAKNLGLKLDPETGKMISGGGTPLTEAEFQAAKKQLRSSKDISPSIAEAQRTGRPQSSRDAIIAKELRSIAASLERLADHINPEKT